MGMRKFHILLIAVLGLLAYSNTLHSPFQWDEEKYIIRNPVVKHLSYFADTSKARGLAEYYAALKSRYIGYLTFALNYRLNGTDVTGYHIVNLFIHIINAILVYFFVALTLRTPFLRQGPGTRDQGPGIKNSKDHLPVPGSRSIAPDMAAFLTSLLFVAHPVQTEAVTYTFQRFASLVTLFYLLSLVMYLVFRLQSEDKTDAGRYRGIAFYILSLVFAVLAMKTKENAFTLPIVIVLYELSFFGGPVKKRALYLVPLILTMLIIPLTIIGTDRPAGEIISQMKDPSSIGYPGISGKEYLLTEFRVIVTYIRLLFLPINQNVDYYYPRYNSFFEPGVFISFLFLGALICAGLYFMYRSRSNPDLRPLGFGILWFFITLSVESSIIPIPMTICEYRMYLPSVGAFMAVISGIFLLVEKFGHTRIKPYLVTSLIFLGVIFSVASYMRNSTWGSKISLWEDVIQKSPLNWRGHYNLGLAYGLTDQAIEQYQIALRLKPDYEEAHNNLGNAYASRGLLDEAIEQYQIALRLKPDYEKGYNNLGNAYASKGLLDQAIEQFKIALRLKPDFEEAHHNLGNAYASKGLLDQAIEQYEIALTLKPDYEEAHYNLGNAYASKGLLDRAIEQYEIALTLKPDYEEAHINLGNAYGVKGLFDKAIEQFKIALTLKPDSARAHYNLGIIYLKTGSKDAARTEFELVLKTKPDDFRARQILNSIISK
jgi:tetratricopeptide (TPR) repeat protein